MVEVVTKLTNGIVVDRNALAKLNADQTAATLTDIYSDPKARVVIVENAVRFFNHSNLFAAIQVGDENLDLIAEHNGVKLSDEDQFVIGKFVELNARLQDELKSLIPPPPLYTFAAVPEGWSLDAKIEIGKSRITRKGGSYMIGPKTLEKVWKTVSRRWASKSPKAERYIMTISASGYDGRNVHINPNNIEIGCQTIERYELEQVALRMGWDFPAGLD